MYELTCPSCNSASIYDLTNYLLMCPFCSVTFHLNTEMGIKDVFQDHYIVASTSNAAQVKGLVLEWLKRLNHKPGTTEKEYFVTSINGRSMPYWVVSMEAHTHWKGLIQKQQRFRLDHIPGKDFIIEEGQFKRNYRWAISARHNICESWGMTRLHEPKEKVEVFWDGFPLDSTFSRGQIQEARSEKSAYDTREFFEFKFANGLPILGIQVPEEEALRRAKLHVEQYHLALARLHVDLLTDLRTEVEIAGIQLIHLPFWQATYMFRPRTSLRYFYKPKEKHVLLDGYNCGILVGELPIQHRDKQMINAIVCVGAALIMFIMGLAWHPSLILVSLFCLAIGGISAFVAANKGQEQKSQESLLEASATSH